MANGVGGTDMENTENQETSDIETVLTPSYDADQEEEYTDRSPFETRERIKSRTHKLCDRENISPSSIEDLQFGRDNSPCSSPHDAVPFTAQVRFAELIKSGNTLSDNESPECNSNSKDSPEPQCSDSKAGTKGLRPSAARKVFFNEMEKAYSGPKSYAEKLYSRVAGTTPFSKRYSSKVPIPISPPLPSEAVFALQPVPTLINKKGELAITYPDVLPAKHPSAKNAKIPFDNMDVPFSVELMTRATEREEKFVIEEISSPEKKEPVETKVNATEEPEPSKKPEDAKWSDDNNVLFKMLQRMDKELYDGISKSGKTRKQTRSISPEKKLSKPRSRSVSVSSVRETVRSRASSRTRVAAVEAESATSIKQSGVRAKRGVPSLRSLKQAAATEADCLVCANRPNCLICSFKYFALIFAARNAISICPSCQEQLTKID